MSLGQPKRNLTAVVPALLFAWYALMSLYATNMKGMVMQDIANVFAITTLAVIVLHLALTALLKQPEKATIISTGLVASFFSFGHLSSWLEEYASPATASTATISILLALLAGAIYYLWTKHQPWPVAKAMPIIIAIPAIALATTLLQIIPQEITNQNQRHQAIQSVTQLNSNPPTSQESRIKNLESTTTGSPDIYYIIPDRYASPRTTAQYYNFDNADFQKQLTDRGFYLATDSRTNYPKTLFSLASSLNMQYLQDILPEDTTDLSEAYAVQPMISNNLVGRTFQDLGYTYYHLGNWYELTQSMDIADRNILPTSKDFLSLNSYTRQLLETTPYPSVAQAIGLPESFYNFGDQTQINWANYQIEQMKQMVHWSGPKFVVAHTLLSHDPYVFDQDCNQLAELIERWNATTQDYLNQLQCTNKQLISIIDTILTNSPTKPIIVIQSDEGPEAMIEPTGHHWKFQDVAQSAIDERTQILNAYYFPDQNYQSLTQTITPVNTFRTILRQYFAQDLPNLADKTYLWPDKDSLFDFYAFSVVDPSS